MCGCLPNAIIPRVWTFVGQSLSGAMCCVIVYCVSCIDRIHIILDR